MPRYLVRIVPSQTDTVKAQLSVLKTPVVSQVFDYLIVNVTPNVAERIKSVAGVVSVTLDKPISVMQVLIPVDRKLAEFQRLFTSNPLTGPVLAFKFVLEADSGKTRVPTSQSRKIMGAEEAEADGITGKGIKVAVLDTGADPTGVQGPYWAGSKSSVEGQPVPLDENGHSTHVMTTISGRPFQSVHGLLKGVAVDAEVAAFKVLGYGLGTGTTSSVLRGIADAVEWGADIMSMSLGGPEAGPDDPENRIISALTKQGMIFCIAAGNSGPDPQTISTPGDGPDSLTVGAIDINGEIASFSSRGPTRDGRIKPDVCAPGVDILSTSTGLIATMQVLDGPPKLAAISGTSMATPHVSGVVALALQYARSKGKTLTTNGIKQAMSQYGDFTSQRNDFGWGLCTYPRLKAYIDSL